MKELQCEAIISAIRKEKWFKERGVDIDKTSNLTVTVGQLLSWGFKFPKRVKRLVTLLSEEELQNLWEEKKVVRYGREVPLNPQNPMKYLLNDGVIFIRIHPILRDMVQLAVNPKDHTAKENLYWSKPIDPSIILAEIEVY